LNSLSQSSRECLKIYSHIIDCSIEKKAEKNIQTKKESSKKFVKIYKNIKIYKI